MLRRYALPAWNVPAIALVTAIVGLITIFSAGTPAAAERALILDDLVALFAQQGATFATVIFGFALLVLARALWQRKRSAWLLAVLLLAITTGTHLLKGLDYVESVLSVGLLLWLLSTRPLFHARSDRPSTVRAVQLLVGAIIFTIFYGTIGFLLIDPSLNITSALGNTIRLFTNPEEIDLTSNNVFAITFIESIYGLAVVTVIAALVLLTRSVILRAPATPQERQRARQIVEQYGRSSVAYMTLFEDKAYFFSAGGSVIAYVTKNNIALALGDPIGPPGDFETCLHGFREFCASNGWQTAFYQTLPDHLDSYRKSGMHALSIGQEAVVDVRQFSLAGGERKRLRKKINRLERMGFTMQVHPAPVSDDLLATMREISDEWLAEIGGSEKQFSLGWFTDDYMRELPIMAIYDADGCMQAFTNLMPEFQRNELTIDLMRHRADMERGVMDLLFVRLFEYAREQGHHTFNLGLAPLAGVGDEPDDSRMEKALHYIFEHLNQFYSFQGLYDFKAKFDPTWEERYLIYPNVTALAAIGVALIRADSGDDAIWTYLREIEVLSLYRDWRARRKGTTIDDVVSGEMTTAEETG